MRAILLSAVSLSVCLAGCPQPVPVDPSLNILRVAVSANGEITVDGQASNLENLAQELEELKEVSGIVWYYRENPQDEPHPNAIKVMQLVIDNGLPISLFLKPDFSEQAD
jgi:hypothetical protein